MCRCHEGCVMLDSPSLEPPGVGWEVRPGEGRCPLSTQVLVDQLLAQCSHGAWASGPFASVYTMGKDQNLPLPLALP